MQRIHIPTRCEVYGNEFWHGQYSVKITEANLSEKTTRLRVRLEKHYGFEIHCALSVTGHFIALRSHDVALISEKAKNCYLKVLYACA